MDGLFFLMSCIAIGVIQYWMFRNDRVGPKEPTRGLLTMKVTGAVRGDAAPAQRGQRAERRQRRR